MGVSISWKQKSKTDFYFESNYTSSDVEKIKKHFGFEISEKDIPKLLAFYEATEREIYNELIQIVNKNGTIIIEVSW